MINVLVVSSKYPPEYAGSALRAHNTYKRLASKFGIKFDVITSSVTSNRSRKYILDGVSVRVIANKSNKKIGLRDLDNIVARFTKRIINKLYTLRDYLSEMLPAFFYLLRNHSKYNLIHIYGNVAITSIAIIYAKITKKPIIIELVNLTNNPHQWEPNPVSLLFGNGFPKQALIVCISKPLRDTCISHGYADKQIWWRPNPVDESKFFYERNKNMYRKTLPGVKETDILLLYLAKFMPLKNQSFMVEVMPYLPYNYKLILAGPLISTGPLLEREQEYYQKVLYAINSRKLQDRVQVIPHFVENPQDYIKAADVFVMPTIIEAFGTPVFEALACGIPVVAHNIPGVFDQWIKDDVNGYLCKLNQKEWADKIILASRIDEDTMQRASEEILRVASTEVIDKGYYERLVSLAKGVE